MTTKDTGPFGLTNETSLIAKASAYRKAAIADGWSCKATYSSEPVLSHATLWKEGFVMHVMARDLKAMYGSKVKFKASVSVGIWGPDGMCIIPPDEYDWDQIKSGVSVCSECGATDIDPERVGFAGRVCSDCLPVVRKVVEYPGWTR